MKKLACLFLVLMMVVIPVSALAATTTVSITLGAHEHGGIRVYDENSVLQSFPFQADPAAKYRVYVNADNNYVIDTVTFGGIDSAGIAQGRRSAVYLNVAFASDTDIAATFTPDSYNIKCVVSDGVPTSLDSIVTDFGTLSGSNIYARADEKVDFTVDVKDSLFMGTLYYSKDNGATWTLLGNTEGLKYTLDDAGLLYAQNTTVYVAAVVDTSVGSITVHYDAANPYGKATVVWTSPTTATVTATPHAGAKFWGWSGVSGVNIVDSQLTSPVLKLVDIGRDDKVTLTASFIKVSGNISSDDSTAGTSDNPKTGDPLSVALICAIGVAAIGGIALAARKLKAR